jgi:DNA gyrase subunit A
MYRLLVNDIPVGTNVSKGQPINSLITMESDEQPATIYSIYRDTDAKYVLFTTKNGVVKKTALEEYIKTKKKSGIAAITLKEGDSLANVVLIKDEPVVLITKSGMGIKFKSEDISASSRTTQGVRGITLKPEDEVIAALPIRDAKDQLAIFSKSGLGKKINLSELPIQSKGGKGLQCYKPTTSSGLVAAAALINDEDNILILGDKNSICISATEIPLMSRPSLGNQVIKNSNILSVSKV